MNLKESFRYQNFLDSMLRSAVSSISQREHCLTITKTHLRSKVNPDAEDMVETVEVEAFYHNDDVLDFLEFLVNEKSVLTQKINQAKASIDIDIDAAIESNKFRQSISATIKNMLRCQPRKTTEQGRDYKFNVEGNQISYYYDIEIESVDSYNRDKAKNLMRNLIAEADKTSTAIDAALINTQVDYEPKFDVNENFEDIMESFISKRNN